MLKTLTLKQEEWDSLHHQVQAYIIQVVAQSHGGRFDRTALGIHVILPDTDMEDIEPYLQARLC